MKKKERSYLWAVIGAAVAVVLSLVYVSCYEMFRTRAQAWIENPVETESNLSWLYQNNQVLYRDLYNHLNQAELSYLELYYQLDEDKVQEFLENPQMQLSEGEYSDEVYEQSAELRSMLSALESYFSSLEGEFSSFNSLYDYVIRDQETGKVLSNAGNAEKMNPEDYYFYLTFRYDENGKVSIAPQILGENPSVIRKGMTELARSSVLPSDMSLPENSSEVMLAEDGLLSELGILSGEHKKHLIQNCEISYGMTLDTWAKLQNDELHSERFPSVWFASYDALRIIGVAQFYIIFVLAAMLLAIFLPFVGKDQPWKRFAILRFPLEVLLFIGVMLISIDDSVVSLVLDMITGRTAGNLQNMGFEHVFAGFLSGAWNVILLAILFFAAFCIGVSLRECRDTGVIGLIRKRSMIYRFFPFIKSKCRIYYDTLIHFDVTKNAKKTITKLVIVNAVILFIISSLWVGGWAFIVIYSLLLYFMLKKYVSDLQKKYSILLNATNEIAKGNLNVGIVEDIGIFEPFKPQIIRIQRGFRNAVEEEVKSQRMKAELITNVSHDLKTPLTAITTYIDLLKDENITEEQRKEYIDILEKKSLRLKVLIEDLFEVSKATSRAVKLNIMDVDIMNLVKQVALEMSDKLNDASLDVRMNLTDEKVILPLDSQKTYRIYENLFGNIAKYALPGTRVYVNGFVIDGTAVITLKNISAQEININPEELTDRFVRGDASRNTEGSGLGLAIAKSFTELQNGKLSLEVDGDLFKVTTTWRMGISPVSGEGGAGKKAL